VGAFVSSDFDDCTNRLIRVIEMRVANILRLRLQSLFLRSKVEAELDEDSSIAWSGKLSWNSPRVAALKRRDTRRSDP
jgi:hypothetical protein